MSAKISTTTSPRKCRSPDGRDAASRSTTSSPSCRSHTYIFTPCREPWPGASVNARLPRVPVLDQLGQPLRTRMANITMATTWLDQNRSVEQMTWAPGLPMLINDRLVVDGGWIERPEVTCFNIYRPPRTRAG